MKTVEIDKIGVRELDCPCPDAKGNCLEGISVCKYLKDLNNAYSDRLFTIECKYPLINIPEREKP